MRVNLMFMEWLSSDYIAAFFAFAIIVLVLVVFWVFSLSKRLVGDLEVLENKPVKVFVTFFVYLAIGLLIAWLVVYSLQNAGGVSSIFYFTILPYMALLMFAIGTVVRYRETGFKVSSLSSQFLEGRKLFWGSQPFHWGILVLFFGHLVAFMFPASILAWNRVPARLLFLEGSAFAFALLTLLGLAMFVYRRFTNKRVQIVTTRTDLVVYVVLLVQVLTGMGVAYYVRWGSSWFASVLSPYLTSIFAFNPDTGAVSAMPWLVQLHIISAFVIIGIIPFTRFVHFLVAPFDYLWRSYQVVIWNWNRSLIRRSSKHLFGKKTRNH